MKRPVGVTIITVLLFIRGLLVLLFGLKFVLFRDAFFKEFRLLSNDTVQLGFSFIVISTIVGTLISLLLAREIFNLKMWAAKATLYFGLLGILNGFRLAVHGGGKTGLGVLNLVINAAIVYYLLRPKVRRAFSR